MSPGQSAPDGRGWLRFASLMLMLVGALNVVSGVVALRNHQFLSHKQLLFSDFTVWGWFFVGWGIIQILAGVAIARRCSGQFTSGSFPHSSTYWRSSPT